jgi:hypothetical protein
LVMLGVARSCMIKFKKSLIFLWKFLKKDICNNTTRYKYQKGFKMAKNIWKFVASLLHFSYGR